jgi:hypothetical protein
MKYIYISFITLIVFNTKLKAQDIKNVDFTFRNNNFIITYDLANCRNNFMYDVKVIMEGRESGTYTPINISGDLNNLTCGNGKKINWSPLAEGKQIKEDVRFIILISKESKIITDGPDNAIKSVFLPGLGGLSVQKTKFPLLLTAGFLFSGIQVYRYNNLSNTNYASYLSATSQSEMNTFFTNAKSAQTKTYIYLGLATSIWVTDLVYTIVRGNKNKENFLNGKKQTTSNWKINLYSDYYSFNIGLKKQIK